MKPEIHPEVHTIEVVCACGSTFETTSTRTELRVDICSACHPFFTGQQRFVDTEGRIDKFQKRFGKDAANAVKQRHGKKAKKKAPEPEPTTKVEAQQAAD